MLTVKLDHKDRQHMENVDAQKIRKGCRDRILEREKDVVQRENDNYFENKNKRWLK